VQNPETIVLVLTPNRNWVKLRISVSDFFSLISLIILTVCPFIQIQQPAVLEEARYGIPDKFETAWGGVDHREITTQQQKTALTLRAVFY
jgi:hypothetical protein